MDVAIVVKPIRATGTPPRCSVCRVACDPAMCGPVLCNDHKPRQQGTALGEVPAKRRRADERSRQATWAAAKKEAGRSRPSRAQPACEESIPDPIVREAIPASVTLRDRLRERRAQERG